MKINYAENTNMTFKKGLTSYEINKVNNMGHREYKEIAEQLKRIYDINADFNYSNTVAFCVNEVVHIMSRAGLKLPKNFTLKPMRKDVFGSYSTSTDTVSINSSNNAFYDLECQNRLEESQGSYHPITGHFLQTYLHEFSHAAHYHHLCDKLGKYQGNSFFWNELTNNSPDDILVGPLNGIIKAKFPKLSKKIINYFFPPENGLYSKTDLTEYFAEKNARRLAEYLGDSYITTNIPANFTDYYNRQHPDNWNSNEEIMQLLRNVMQPPKPRLTPSNFWEMLGNTVDDFGEVVGKLGQWLQREIRYTDSDIWNGNEKLFDLKFSVESNK